MKLIVIENGKQHVWAEGDTRQECIERARLNTKYIPFGYHVMATGHPGPQRFCRQSYLPLYGISDSPNTEENSVFFVMGDL
jgi:hypothetical protein